MTTQITEVLVPPSRSSTPATFSAAADTFVGQLPTWTTQANAVATEVNAKEVSAVAAAVTATTQAGLASGSATTATTQAGLAAGSASSASGFATAASGSATSASGFATAASGSASAAAASAASISGGPVTSVNTHTGVVVLAKSDIGLGSVDNTADASKIVSSAATLTTPRNINGVAFDGSANITINAVDATARIASSLIGVASGIAPLGADSKIASTYLPSYVDDVLEVANYAALPGAGETGKIYVALDTNKTWRWSGSVYVEISASPGSSDAVTEGTTNLYYTTARAAAKQDAGAIVDTNPIVKGSADATKQMRFEVDGLTTGTTRVITVPNADITIAAAGANSDITSLSAITSINGGPLAGFRNRIINGRFDVWQRGVSVTPSLGNISGYVSDRWVSYQGGAATAINQAAGTGEFRYCASFAGVASNTEVTMIQYIESSNCYSFTGASAITLSAWVYANVAKTITVYIDTANVENVFSATTNKVSTVLSHAGAGWQKLTLTYTSPDTTVQRGIRVRFHYPACTTGAFGLTGVQLEPGSVATPFEQRPYGVELALCQRYYESSWVTGGTPAVSNLDSSTACYVEAISTSRAVGLIKFSTPKRIAPTVTIYNYTPTAGKVSNVDSSNSIGTTVTAQRVSDSGVSDLVDSGAGFAVGTYYWFGYTATAEL